MHLFAEQPVSNSIVLAMNLAIAACVAVWVWVASLRSQHRPILPYQPRRPVPWGIIDVVAMTIAYVFTPAILLHALYQWHGVSIGAALEATDKALPLDASHPVARVLSEHAGTWPLLMCVALVIVIAPITEELLFRLLLQGWLETVERRLRWRLHGLRSIARGVLPVATVAVLFAAIHIRKPEPRIELTVLIYLLSVQAIASVLVIILLLAWLKYAAGATLADLGVVPAKVAGDLRLGLLTFLAVTPPVYAITIAAKMLLPESVVADPIPLLFLAVALGTLYYRTHRIVPSMVLHMAFNAVGVLMAIATS